MLIANIKRTQMVFIGLLVLQIHNQVYLDFFPPKSLLLRCFSFPPPFFFGGGGGGGGVPLVVVTVVVMIAYFTYYKYFSF